MENLVFSTLKFCHLPYNELIKPLARGVKAVYVCRLFFVFFASTAHRARCPASVFTPFLEAASYYLRK
jgi:hypothetical protein